MQGGQNQKNARKSIGTTYSQGATTLLSESPSSMSVDLRWAPVDAPSKSLSSIEWRVRVRWPYGFRPIVSVKSDSSSCTVVGFDAASETVSVKLSHPYNATLTVSY
jgi:hypothetical protein